ncbi:OmpH family outer membrane protein [Candidatus Erwinia haradaeae]|uniref:Chaperone protein Skp n=1 Tax=Candidatus Erwinia haradaeae TaxID=1922217 RepID=A0A451D207_9GAMM|nr:OmpH family outer membrane protein [Candidatus Erwinia haradaeae]VFP79644.1 Chaperone protein Skp [Candidatus Erwinia haradaeae]
MKKFLYAVTMGCVLIFSMSVQASNKIAVVNVVNIFQQLPEFAIITHKLENEFRDRTNTLQSMEHELQMKIQHLQRDRLTMKENEQLSMEKDILTQREKFNTEAQIFEQDNRRRQIEERNKILNKIQHAVEKVASLQGYDLVIDQSAVAYFIKSKDITTDVLKQVK